MIRFNDLADNAERFYKKIIKKPEVKDENQILISNLKAINDKIARSESMFNELTDQDLIDYTAYNLLAEKAQYAYLIKEAKKRNLHF